MGILERKDARTPPSTNGGDWLERFGEGWKKDIESIKEKFGAGFLDVVFPGEAPTDVPTVTVKKEVIVGVLEHLKTDLGYGFLSDITATDEESDPRFLIVYNIFSHARKCRFRVKIATSEGAGVPTATSVWPGANWAEREIWDMFGVRFDGHPDLRRILMDERWVGHPLRKDYPLRGYQLFSEPMQIRQELLEKGDQNG